MYICMYVLKRDCVSIRGDKYIYVCVALPTYTTTGGYSGWDLRHSTAVSIGSKMLPNSSAHVVKKPQNEKFIANSFVFALSS